MIVEIAAVNCVAYGLKGSSYEKPVLGRYL